jgi:hypothetical protein
VVDELSESETLADVVDRLGREFGRRMPERQIVLTVRRARRELDIISGPALPELVERLARQRLRSAARSAAVPA